MADTPFLAIRIDFGPDLGPVVARLEQLLAGQARQEEKMSALSDALAGVVASNATLAAEVHTVKQFLLDHAGALNEAVTAGDMATITQLNQDLQAETAELAGALPAAAEPSA